MPAEDAGNRSRKIPEGLTFEETIARRVGRRALVRGAAALSASGAAV